MTRHVDVARSPEVLKALPALAQLAGGIGDPAVRNRGTIGGSLANNDPNADYPAAALALGATIVTSTREIAADRFFRGMFETALAPGELITAVKLLEPGAVNGHGVDPAGLSSDIHAEAAFRAHLISVMAKRAVTTALANS